MVLEKEIENKESEGNLRTVVVSDEEKKCSYTQSLSKETMQ
jgi:hypothetical protein